MSDEIIYPVIVTVILKPQQQYDHNLWYVTIKGEHHLVKERLVTWQCENMNEALSSFVSDEISYLEIIGTLKPKLYGRQQKIYGEL